MQLFDVKKLDDSCAWSVDCVFCYISSKWFMCKNIVCGNFFLLESFWQIVFYFRRELCYLNSHVNLNIALNWIIHEPLINSCVCFTPAGVFWKQSYAITIWEYFHFFFLQIRNYNSIVLFLFLIGIKFQSRKKIYAWSKRR